MAMSDYSLSDIAAITDAGNRNGGNGFGDGNGAWWLLVLFALLGGFGNNGRGYGNGGCGGGQGGADLYPWINQSQQVNDGFRDQMVNDTINATRQGINGLSTQLCGCCGDMQMGMANGFAGVNSAISNGFSGVNMSLAQGFAGMEQGANARQMANMQQAFAAQTATSQGFNGLQAQLADCCCENRLATANQTATILSEHCADRNALQMGIRDVIESQTRGNQAIMDKLCQLELDGVKSQLSQAERENLGLQNQLNMASFRESQAAQNTLIQQGLTNEVDALYNRLSNCPVPSMPVYGRTPIFQCQPQNRDCGCNCGM